MDGDRPIRSRAEDRLGFAPIAEHLAQVILDQAVKDGLVFGIEGKWGSGKSTIVNLTIDALQAREGTRPEIIEFSPWLVGDRDSMLAHLFGELANAIVKIEPLDAEEATQPTNWREKICRIIVGQKRFHFRKRELLRKKLGNKLKAFGAIASRLSKVGKAAAIAVPYADIASTAIERAGEAASALFSSNSLAERKAELVAALKLLSRRIVVFVDDLDRLDPAEASEVLRLIRAVGDFPNILYLLSYDPDVVSRILEKAVQIDNGSAYLEKIVQVSFRVPRPEAFDLRRWFQEEVHQLFPHEIGAGGIADRLVGQRLAQVIDLQGGRYLRTPRHIVRALNALRLHAIPVRAQIDIADMVFLQLVRIGNPALYSWIEEYLTDVSAVARGAQTTDHAGATMADRLEQILSNEGIDVGRAWFDLGQVLPGLEGAFQPLGNGGRRVFSNLNRAVFDTFIRERRLGSPEHYRYYFACAQPSGALRDEEVETFLELAQQNANGAVRLFADMAGEERPQGGVMAEVMLDRIISSAERIPSAAIPAIFDAFAATMDNIALADQSTDFGQPRAWYAAQRAVSLLLKPLQPNERRYCLRHLFAGEALGWLSSMLRDEIFSHGHFGDRQQPENERLLTTEEFQEVLSMMLRRYAETPPDTLLRVPNLISLLYGWAQGGSYDAPWQRGRARTMVCWCSCHGREAGWRVVLLV